MVATIFFSPHNDYTEADTDRGITRLKLIRICLLRNSVTIPIYNINKIEMALQHETYI